MRSHNFQACQLYIKALWSYTLKMASWEPKHCSCYVLLIKHILYNKVVLDYKLIYFFFIFGKGGGISHVLEKSLTLIHIFPQIKEQYQYFYLISDNLIAVDGRYRIHTQTTTNYD